MSHVFHHQHKRKRAHVQGQQFPHPHPWKRFLDKAVYVIGIVNPLMGGVQAWKIWSTQNAEGVSLISFSFNVFANIVLLTYGISHKEKLLIVMYTLWLCVNASIVLGTLLYG